MRDLRTLDGGAGRMSDERTLREKIREMIQVGTLPNRRPDRMWGGPGGGAECTICSVPVRLDEVELEIEFARNGNDPGLDNYHLHYRCLAAWESERHNLELAGPPEANRHIREQPLDGEEQ
jgi:hypothetical protein